MSLLQTCARLFDCILGGMPLVPLRTALALFILYAKQILEMKDRSSLYALLKDGPANLYQGDILIEVRGLLKRGRDGENLRFYR